MKKLKSCALALIVGSALAAGPMAGAASAISGTPGHGCPRGAFCVYPGIATWNTGPEKTNGIFYSYGYHNIHGQYGDHMVYNNQYPVNGVQAGASFCFGYNGKGGQDGGAIVNSHWAARLNLNNVNSINLWLYEYSYIHEFNCTM